MTIFRLLSGHLVVQLCHLNSIFELYPFNHLAQLPEPSQPSPPLLGALSQFEHHTQLSVAAQTPFSSPSAMSNRHKRQFKSDWWCECSASAWLYNRKMPATGLESCPQPPPFFGICSDTFQQTDQTLDAFFWRVWPFRSDTRLAWPSAVPILAVR